MISHPHTSIVPGVMIFLIVMSINLLGDGVRDALDPRLRSGALSRPRATTLVERQGEIPCRNRRPSGNPEPRNPIPRGRPHLPRCRRCLARGEAGRMPRRHRRKRLGQICNSPQSVMGLVASPPWRDHRRRGEVSRRRPDRRGLRDAPPKARRPGGLYFPGPAFHPAPPLPHRPPTGRGDPVTSQDQHCRGPVPRHPASEGRAHPQCRGPCRQLPA